MFLLCRCYAYIDSTKVGYFETKDAAIAKVESLGYEVIDQNEDEENPGHWDVAAAKYGASGQLTDVDIFTIEPTKGD